MKYDYRAIVEHVCELYSDQFDDWESNFMNNIILTNDFNALTERQKTVILKINRKYRCKR